MPSAPIHTASKLRPDAENMVDVDDALAAGSADEIAQHCLPVFDWAALEVVPVVVQQVECRNRGALRIWRARPAWRRCREVTGAVARPDGLTPLPPPLPRFRLGRNQAGGGDDQA